MPWYKVGSRREASPCNLRRKFGYIASRHRQLAALERRAKRLKERLRSKASITAAEKHILSRAEAELENKRKWLDYYSKSTKEILRFARAQARPRSTDGRQLKEILGDDYSPVRVSEESRKLICHYATVFDEFQWAQAVAAGHSGADEAMKNLMRLSTKILAKWKLWSGQESQDADQQAALGLIEAASRYDPTHKSMARFATYAAMRVRRRTQVRADRHCAPGTAFVFDPASGKRKQLSQRSINEPPPGNSSDLLHPANSSSNVPTVDVKTALMSLDEEERELAQLRFMESRSIRKIAEDKDLTVSVLRRQLIQLKEKLATLLADYSPVCN